MDQLVPQTCPGRLPRRHAPWAGGCQPLCGGSPEVQGAGRQCCPLASLPTREAQAASVPPSPGSPNERVAPTVEAGRAQTDARSSRGAWTRGSAVAEGGWRGSWAPALRPGLHGCLGLGNAVGAASLGSLPEPPACGRRLGESLSNSCLRSPDHRDDCTRAHAPDRNRKKKKTPEEHASRLSPPSPRAPRLCAPL